MVEAAAVAEAAEAVVAAAAAEAEAEAEAEGGGGGGGGGGPTVIVPVISTPWIKHRYGNEPALLKVNENESPAP